MSKNLRFFDLDINKIIKFDNQGEVSWVKFNKNQARYFSLRRGGFKFCDGSYRVGNDRAKFKTNEV